MAHANPPEWEYDVLFGEDDDQLVVEVNAAMRKGWYPVGGIAVSVIPQYENGELFGACTYLRQAVIRHRTGKRAKP
jgi:hypothetical protein